MTQFAKGPLAWGECQRSGRKMLLKDLVVDGQYPYLLVDPDWRDPQHPIEKMYPSDDPVALRHPSPRRDLDSAQVRFPRFDVATGRKGSELFDVFDTAFDLDNDAFKVALFDGKPSEIYSTQGELEAGEGYITGGQSLALTRDGTELFIADTVWPDTYFEVHWLLVYGVATSNALMRVEMGSIAQTERAEFRILWDTAKYVTDGAKILRVVA